MRTVEDRAGNRYVLLKESADTSLVRDPESGTERHLPTAALSPVDEPPLQTATRAIPPERRRELDGVTGDRAIGLLLVLDASGPIPVRDLLAETTLCESDLHGIVGELRAGGHVREADVGGERGYAVTEDASKKLDRLRD